MASVWNLGEVRLGESGLGVRRRGGDLIVATGGTVSPGGTVLATTLASVWNLVEVRLGESGLGVRRRGGDLNVKCREGESTVGGGGKSAPDVNRGDVRRGESGAHNKASASKSAAI